MNRLCCVCIVSWFVDCFVCFVVFFPRHPPRKSQAFLSHSLTSNFLPYLFEPNWRIINSYTIRTYPIYSSLTMSSSDSDSEVQKTVPASKQQQNKRKAESESDSDSGSEAETQQQQQQEEVRHTSRKHQQSIEMGVPMPRLICCTFRTILLYARLTHFTTLRSFVTWHFNFHLVSRRSH